MPIKRRPAKRRCPRRPPRRRQDPVHRRRASASRRWRRAVRRRDQAVDGDTYNVLYDDGDREIDAAAFMRKEATECVQMSLKRGTDNGPRGGRHLRRLFSRCQRPPNQHRPPPVETAPPHPDPRRAASARLAKACRRGDVDSVQSLLDRDAPVGETLLHDINARQTAIDAATPSRLIMPRIKVRPRLDRVGRPPLFSAVLPGPLRLALRGVAGRRTTATLGVRPCSRGRGGTDVVEFMVENGARIDARDDRGRCPSDARRRTDADVVKSLCSRTGRLSSAENPLEVAISRRH